MSARLVLTTGILLLAGATSAHAGVVSEPQEFAVSRKGLVASFAAEIKAEAHVTLVKGRVSVSIDSEVKVLHNREPGGVERVSWRLECANAGNAFTAIRVSFTSGTVAFKPGGSAPIPPYGSSVLAVEADYDWHDNQRTVVFTRFRPEGAEDVHLRVSPTGSVVIDDSLVPKPKESAAELAQKREEEAAKARAAALERFEEIERLLIRVEALNAQAGADGALVAVLSQAAERETDAVKKEGLLAEARKREASHAALVKAAQDLDKRIRELRPEARRLLANADRLTREGEEMRKTASAAGR